MTDYSEIYEPVQCLIRMRHFADRFYHNLMDRHKDRFPLELELIIFDELMAALNAELTPQDAENLFVFAAAVARDLPLGNRENRNANDDKGEEH